MADAIRQRMGLAWFKFHDADYKAAVVMAGRAPSRPMVSEIVRRGISLPRIASATEFSTSYSIATERFRPDCSVAGLVWLVPPSYIERRPLALY